jgi:DNA-binding transcriptional LysR family regulator
VRIHASAILYFDAVRRAGSIREAARRLNVASSAVNRQILKLEAEIGTPLFERLPNGTRLSSAGEALARHVLVVMQDFERARSDIEGLRGAQAGHIAIAAVEGVCITLMPKVIETFRKRAPRVTLSVESLGSLAIPRAVAEGNVDIGIAFSLPRRPELRQVALARFRLGAIMPPSHPLAGRESVSLATCLAYPLILPSGDLSIGQALAPALAQVSRAVQPVVRSSSVETMRELAVRGVGLAFQTRIGVDRPPGAQQLVHVPIEASGPIWSDLGVYIRAERALPAAVDVVLRLIIEEIRRYEAEENET